MHLLELKHIYKSYHQGGIFGRQEKLVVLKDINLALKSGTCTGLLGRSGSGKSTLGRIALDLELPDSGKVLYNGRPLNTLNRADYREYRQNVQVVFQNTPGSVNPRLTAAQIIAEPLQNFLSLSAVQLRKQILELLERVGLSAVDADKYSQQFSGGELQRLCIARAIALNPKLIILDEAVNNLDMLIQARMIDLLMTLKKDLGAAYLFISHDIRVLLKISDRLAVMHEGRIVEQSENMSEVEQFSHPAFRDLLNATLPATPVRTPA